MWLYPAVVLFQMAAKGKDKIDNRGLFIFLRYIVGLLRYRIIDFGYRITLYFFKICK